MTTDAPPLVVGLGNPGRRYRDTRHNVGFEVVDYLAAAPGVTPFKPLFHSLVAETTDGSEKVLLVKPETFMNLSGRAVRAIIDFYKLPTEHVLVTCDDFNLPLGKLRLGVVHGRSSSVVAPTSGSAPVSGVPPASSATNPASSSTVTPSSAAFCSLEPAPGPATR